MQSNKSKIVFAVIIAALVISGGIYYWQTSQTIKPSDETASWQTYENEEIGLSFKYPASYGTFHISMNNGDTGKRFTGSFQNNEYFSIGGITADYTAGRSGDFLFFVRYLYEDEKYYHLMALDKKYLMEPIKTMKIDNQTILIVNGDSYIEEKKEGLTISPGSNGGALINLPNTGDFKGVAIWNSDITVLPQSNFEEILKTFKITK